MNTEFPNGIGLNADYRFVEKCTFCIQRTRAGRYPRALWRCAWPPVAVPILLGEYQAEPDADAALRQRVLQPSVVRPGAS